MITFNPEILKIPAFMTKFVDIDNLSSFKKFLLVFKGKFTSYVFNNLSKKNICRFINIFFKPEGNLIYSNGYFIIKTKEIDIYYPNTRFTRIIINQERFLEYLFKSYLLDYIDFADGDFIIDCGANVGELNLAFKQKKININYIGIEPEPRTFFCLDKNSDGKNLNLCLSEKEESVQFYIDSLGANSSMISSQTTNKSTDIASKRLDNIFLDKKIKLLKIDAEGSEPEVLNGTLGIIKNIEYISVDCGAERGVSQETTFREVYKIMTQNNFEIIDIYQQRFTVLFRNKK